MEVADLFFFAYFWVSIGIFLRKRTNYGGNVRIYISSISSVLLCRKYEKTDFTRVYIFLLYLTAAFWNIMLLFFNKFGMRCFNELLKLLWLWNVRKHLFFFVYGHIRK